MMFRYGVVSLVSPSCAPQGFCTTELRVCCTSATACQVDVEMICLEASHVHAQNATEELERLEHAFDAVRQQLFRRLHDGVRAQIFSPAQPAAAPGPALHRAPALGSASASSSSLPEAVSSSSSANGNGSGRGRAVSGVVRGAEGGAQGALAPGGSASGGVNRK